MLYKQHTQSKLHTNGTDKQWISFKKTFFKSLLRSATVSACSGYSSSYSSGAIKAGLYAKKCAATCTCHCLGWVFSVVRERGGDQNHSAHQAFFSPHKVTQGCSNICPYNSSVTLYFPGFVSDSLSLLLFPLRHPSVRAPTSQRVLSPTQVSAKLVMFLAFIL